jgi:hypothetical protein
MLNLYLIERPDCGYDEMESLVVAAATPKLARELAKGTRGDQSPDVWAHGKAKLQKLGTAGPRVKQGVVHENFNAG